LSAAAEAAARRARLWSPPGGVPSSELDIESPVARRRRLGIQQREERRRRREQAILAAAAKVAADWRGTHTFETMGPRLQCNEIMRACCKHFGLRRVEIMAHRRLKSITYARQVAMYVMAEFTPNSLPEIGRRCGGFDHTTVLHAWRRMQIALPADQKLQADVAAVKQALGIGADND
jgi:hypothetical protein